jgi:putative NADH-flavin reductase
MININIDIIEQFSQAVCGQGAAGMLGSNLVRLPIYRGHEVSVLIHPSSRSGSLEGLGITRLLGDILKPSTLNPAVAGNDAVINAVSNQY